MISREEVQQLAELARLRISEDEIRGLQKDISNILDYVGQVSAVSQGETLESPDIKVSPLVHNVMRDDVERKADDVLAGKRASILSQLPKREGDYNVVRKIISKDE
jgi:aspartyl-tRNA(Asn)/glutamyl-tRNA(Gln) amidotransferase subunit C